MTVIERDEDGFVVDASLLVGAFGLREEEVRQGMRDGAITTRCEAGVENDAARWRLTLRHRNRAFRIVLNDAGTIIRRSQFETGPRL